MSIRLAKELQELAIPWAQGIGLALLLLVVRREGDASLVVFALLCFYLTSRLFGAERDHATLPRLLAQPISRLRILLEKQLAAGLLLVLGAAVVLAAIVATGHEPPISMEIVALILLVGLVSGPALSLLIGDSLQAFWVSVALPCVVLLVTTIVWNFLRELEPGGGFISLPVLFLPYSAVILGLGIHRLRIFELGGHDRSVRSAIAVESRSRSLLSELFLKELRLHVNVLPLIPLAVVGWGLVWWLWSDVLAPARGLTEDMLGIFAHLFWLTLIVIVPALVGAGTIAAERQLGVLAWQLALPVPRRLQWRVKIAVCGAIALVSTALGVGLYWLMMPQIPMVVLSLMLSAVALLAGFSGSRLARNPFRALGLTSVVFVITAYTILQLSSGAGLLRYLGWLPGRPETLVSWLPLAVLAAVALAVPRPELWISAGGFRYVAGLSAVLLALLVTAFSLQIAGLEGFSTAVEREIEIRERELASSDLPKQLGWLARALELDVESYRAEELGPILEFVKRRCFTEPELELSGYFRPVSPAMRVLVLIDGSPGGRLSSLYWTRAVKGFHTRFDGRQSSTGVLPNYFEEGLSTKLWYSPAPRWRRQHRREVIDRNARLEAVAEALRVSEVLGGLRERDPSRFDQILAGNGPGFGSISHNVPAGLHGGKDVRLRALVRAGVEGQESQAGIWLRVDRSGERTGFFKIMAAAPTTSDEWGSYEIEGQVAENATAIAFGALLKGYGQAWFDAFELEVRDDSGAWQRLGLPNPGFESEVLYPWTTGSRSYAYQVVETSESDISALIRRPLPAMGRR